MVVHELDVEAGHAGARPGESVCQGLGQVTLAYRVEAKKPMMRTPLWHNVPVSTANWIALIAITVSAAIAVFIFQRNGPRVKYRAFMFCWRGRDDWKIVIEAKNLGRISVNIDILGLEYDVVHPSGKTTVERKKLMFEHGPNLPCELKPRDPPTIWIADGRSVRSASSYGNPRPGAHETASVIIRNARWKPRKIRIKGTPRSWTVKNYIDEKLGWSDLTSS